MSIHTGAGLLRHGRQRFWESSFY